MEIEVWKAHSVRWTHSRSLSDSAATPGKFSSRRAPSSAVLAALRHSRRVGAATCCVDASEKTSNACRSKGDASVGACASVVVGAFDDIRFDGDAAAARMRGARNVVVV